MHMWHRFPSNCNSNPHWKQLKGSSNPQEHNGLISGLVASAIPTHRIVFVCLETELKVDFFLWTLVKSQNYQTLCLHWKQSPGSDRMRGRWKCLFLIKLVLKMYFLLIKRRWLHNLLHSLPLLRIRDLFSEQGKKSISAKFIHGFLRSMRVHSEELGGTQFIPVNVFEGELPLMLFSLPLRSKSILELSRPAAAREELPSQSSPLPTRHLHSTDDNGEWRLMWGKEIRVGWMYWI